VDAVIKRLYLANGTLTTPLASTSEDIAVDSTLGAYLAAQLDVGDWTYLSLMWQDKVEIIRLHMEFSGLEVDRGINGQRHSYPAGSVVKYQLTQQEIQDATNSAPLNLYASGYGAATVDNTGSTWTVGYPTLTTQTVGGIETYYTDLGELVITDKIGAFGCCGEGLDGAPGIDGPFFYFTSMLYPLNITDSGIDGMPQGRAKDGHPFNWPFDFQLLNKWFTQVDMRIAATLTAKDFNLYGGAHSYAFLDKAYATIVVEDSLLYGANHTYAATENLYSDAYPLSALLYGGAVTYSTDIDQLYGTISVSNMTVA